SSPPSGDLRSRWTTALVPGVIVGSVEAVLAASVGALIFTGALAGSLSRGMGFALAGAGVSLLVMGWRGGSPGTVSGLQASVAVVLAVVVANAVEGVAPDQVEATAFVMVASATVVVGAVLGLAGKLKLANIIRFVPFPVVGGFLAGTGWLLIKGAVNVMAGRSIGLSEVSDLLNSDDLRLLIPGAALGVALVIAQRTIRRPWVLPVFVLGALVLFWFSTFVFGSVDEARAGGWLLGPFAESPRWVPIGPSTFADADWGAIFGQVGDLLTIIVLATVGLLFNANSIEIMNGEDLDLDGELSAAGLSNVFTGLVGGPPGYHHVTLTMLGRALGDPNRMVAYVGAVACFLVAFVGGGLIEYVPRLLLGGLIVSFGVALLYEWLVAFRRRLPPAEYAVVLAIVLVVAFAGFLQGVGVGIALSAGLFAWTYSKTDTVKHRLTGSEFTSKVNRSPQHQSELYEMGEHIDILELQGFLFFGSVHKVIESIQLRAMQPEGREVRFVVIDFRRIRGIDSSVVLSFMKLARLAGPLDFTVVMTGVNPEIKNQLQVGGFDESLPGVEFFPDLDHGLEWCEDVLLGVADAQVDHTHDAQHLLSSLMDVEGGADRLRQYVERVEVKAGEALIQQGTAATDLFIVESGSLTAQLELEGQPIARLARVGTGSVVGELGFYTGELRTASVLATTDCVVERVGVEAVARMEREDPDLALALHRAMVRLVSDRLARANDAVRALID
ncbi:MAG: cyclic nucleotide-binding domain-containing protein, partial [Acidimicrobiia bacterium]|nr:cyclic nucleotide-binding domain-containing protein [Acidimicrobiia bacterium]